jgi:sec-independent protein translocase protein TatA
MFGSIGGPELVVIFIVALLIFGPRKLPELGRMLGKGMAEFRRAANDLKDSLETEVAREQPARRDMKAITAPASVPISAGGSPAAGVAPEGVESPHLDTPVSPTSTAPNLPDAEEPAGHS